MIHYKCNKCGATATSDTPVKGFMCTRPMPFRTSGICGGSLVQVNINEQLK